jgi:hypothetical protein
VAFKPGRGLVVTSADGNYELGVGLRAQFLSTIQDASDADPQQSFQVRRARFGSTGHILSPQLKYRIELAVSPRDVNTQRGVPQTSPLFDFFVDLVHLRDASLRIGQYKVPFDRERIISSAKLQFVERAITDAEFTLERDIGMDVHSDNLLGLNLFRYYLGIYPGEGRNSFDLGNFGLLYLARAEVLPFGLFDDYSEGDLERTGFRLSVGAAYASMDDAPRDHGILGAAPADGGTSDMQVATADVMVKFEGFSALSELIWRKSERNPGPLADAALDEAGDPIGVTPTRDGLGFLIQGGYVLLPVPLELVLRYAVLDGSNSPNRDALIRMEEFAGGLSYYFSGHPVKLQADYTLLAENGDYEGGIKRARVQLQVGF